jgi:hypothetical protein
MYIGGGSSGPSGEPAVVTDAAVPAAGGGAAGASAEAERIAREAAAAAGASGASERAAAEQAAAEAYERGDQKAALRFIEDKRAETRRKAARYKLKDADLAPVYESLDAMGSGMASTPPSAADAPAMTKAAKASAYGLAK